MAQTAEKSFRRDQISPASLQSVQENVISLDFYVCRLVISRLRKLHNCTLDTPGRSVTGLCQTVVSAATSSLTAMLGLDIDHSVANRSPGGPAARIRPWLMSAKSRGKLPEIVVKSIPRAFYAISRILAKGYKCCSRPAGCQYSSQSFFARLASCMNFLFTILLVGVQ